METKIKEVTLYKDLWCNVFACSTGKYLMLHKSDTDHVQPNEYWEKSFRYGFEENIPGKHSLYVCSYKDYKRIKTIDSNTSKGYFELLGRKIYVLESLTKPYNVPKYYQLTEEEYKTNYTASEISKLAVLQLRRVICDGFKNSGKNYFSFFDLVLENTDEILLEDEKSIKYEFKIINKENMNIPLAVFEETKYETLSYFLSYEAEGCKNAIIKEIEDVLNTPYKHKVVLTGKSCSVDITPNRVIVDHTVNGIPTGKLCELDTKAFKILLLKWYSFIIKNKDSIGKNK